MDPAELEESVRLGVLLREKLTSLLEHMQHEGEANLAMWQKDLGSLESNGELTWEEKYQGMRQYVMDILLPQQKEFNARVVVEGKALMGTHPQDLDVTSDAKRPRMSSASSSAVRDPPEVHPGNPAEAADAPEEREPPEDALVVMSSPEADAPDLGADSQDHFWDAALL